MSNTRDKESPLGIFDLYSKRQKRYRGEVPDVYIYDELPQPLRVQIVHIWGDLLGNSRDYYSNSKVQEAYIFIVEALRREYGVFELATSSGFQNKIYFEELRDFILSETNTERCMDAVEISFEFADCFCREYGYRRNYNASEIVDACTEELNERFKEHGIGFQFINGEIIRIDSQLLHSEVVKPALSLLNRPGYDGPRDEFLGAYEHYRHKKYKEALYDALKSFESMIKAICNNHNWEYDSRDTAKNLVNVCIKNGLFPSYYQNHLMALGTLLESSVPVIRNKESGHGQGDKVVDINPSVVAYTLHMTASAIVMLGELEKSVE